MSGHERNTMRSLSALELEQVGGGCPGGFNCDCPGTTRKFGGGVFGGDIFTNCAGYIYVNGIYSGRNR